MQVRRWLLDEKVGKLSKGSSDLKIQHTLQLKEFKERWTSLKQAMSSGNFRLDGYNVDVVTSSNIKHYRSLGRTATFVADELEHEKVY